MASYGMNDVKNGMKILINNEPAIITDTEYVKPGKGQAFTRVKYRQIRTGRVQEITMKSTDSVEAADVVDTDMQYLYSDGEYWHFMQQETFEQVQADKNGTPTADIQQASFNTPVTVKAGETFTLTVNAKAPNTGGTFLGLSQLALHGDAVPEPATASLGLLGLAALLLRRRV